MSFDKLLNKYKKIPIPAKATFWAIICNILQKCISFITTPIFTRMLTTEQFGICSMFDSWYMIIVLFTSLSIYSNSFNNAMVKYEKEKEKYISVASSLINVISLIFCSLVIIFRKFFSRLMGLPVFAIYILTLQLIFIPNYSIWMAKKRYEYEYVSAVIATLFITVGSPVLGVILIKFTEYKAEAKILAFGVTQIVLGIVFLIHNVFKGKKIYDKEIWIYVLKFNIPLIPYYLSSMLLAQSDRIMIGKMEGPEIAAIYSLAYTLSLIMTIISNAINQSLIPYIYKKLKKNIYTGIDKIVSMSCGIVTGINIILMLIGPELILFFGTNEYQSAIWVIPPVAASVLYIYIYQMFGIILMYFEKNKVMVISSSFTAILNIILNYFGIKKWGYIAAGYTTLISYMILSSIYYIQYNKCICKELNNYKIYNIKHICGLSTIVLTMIGVALFLYKCNILYRVGFFAVLILIATFNRRKIIENIKEIGGANGKN